MDRVYKIIAVGLDITTEKMSAVDAAGQIAAIGKSQAVIEFQMDGTIIQANDNFLKRWATHSTKSRADITACSSMRPPQSRVSRVLGRLNRGEYQAAEYKRIGKGGREVWIQASYNPILDLNGKPSKSSNMPPMSPSRN